jgi:hypothetical protein
MQKPLQYIKFLKMFLSLVLCYWSDRFPSSIAIMYLFTRLNICKYLYWNVVLKKDGDQLDRSYRKEAKKEKNFTRTNTHTHTHTSCIGHILPRNRFLNHVIEGNIEVTERRGWWQKQLLDDPRKRESTGDWKRKHCLEKSLWKKLWTCLKIDNVITTIARNLSPKLHVQN